MLELMRILSRDPERELNSNAASGESCLKYDSADNMGSKPRSIVEIR